MRFDSYIPCAILKPYVKTFIISETIEEKTYKVLPDTSLVIGFQYRGNLSLLVKEQHIKLNSSGLSGLQDSYRIFKNSANIGTVLVYFNDRIEVTLSITKKRDTKDKIMGTSHPAPAIFSMPCGAHRNDSLLLGRSRTFTRPICLTVCPQNSALSPHNDSGPIFGLATGCLEPAQKW